MTDVSRSPGEAAPELLALIEAAEMVDEAIEALLETPDDRDLQVSLAIRSGNFSATLDACKGRGL